MAEHFDSFTKARWFSDCIFMVAVGENPLGSVSAMFLCIFWVCENDGFCFILPNTRGMSYYRHSISCLIFVIFVIFFLLKPVITVSLESWGGSRNNMWTQNWLFTFWVDTVHLYHFHNLCCNIIESRVMSAVWGWAGTVQVKVFSYKRLLSAASADTKTAKLFTLPLIHTSLLKIYWL